MEGHVLDYIHPEPPKVNALKDELEHFIAAITANTPVAVSSADGRQAIMVADRITREIAANVELVEKCSNPHTL